MENFTLPKTPVTDFTSGNTLPNWRSQRQETSEAKQEAKQEAKSEIEILLNYLLPENNRRQNARRAGAERRNQERQNTDRRRGTERRLPPAQRLKQLRQKFEQGQTL